MSGEGCFFRTSLYFHFHVTEFTTAMVGSSLLLLNQGSKKEDTARNAKRAPKGNVFLLVQ